MTNQIMDLGFEAPAKSDNTMQKVSESRATAEVQAQYIIAKKFPRDQNGAYLRIIKACERPFLAEQAMYAYPKGGQVVTGPSIRLAESMAQNWGNLDCGIRELSQSDGISVAEAYAIDLETNTRVSKIFHVPHYRDTKKGRHRLTDQREIYELVANQGARRMRACILAVLPGDVVEAAVERCKTTLKSSDVPIADQVKRLLIAFDDLGVKPEHIEKRLGHVLDAIIPAEIVTLRSIYKSIKDGMADRSQFFEIAGVSAATSALEKLKETVKKINTEEENGEEEKGD